MLRAVALMAFGTVDEAVEFIAASESGPDARSHDAVAKTLLAHRSSAVRFAACRSLLRAERYGGDRIEFLIGYCDEIFWLPDSDGEPKSSPQARLGALSVLASATAPEDLETHFLAGIRESRDFIGGLVEIARTLTSPRWQERLLELLADVLTDEGEPLDDTATIGLIEFVGELGVATPSIDQVLRTFLGCAVEEVHAAALLALAKRGEGSGVDDVEIVKEYGHYSPVVRSAALVAATIGRLELRHELWRVSRYDETQPDVRVTAAAEVLRFMRTAQRHEDVDPYEVLAGLSLEETLDAFSMAARASDE